MFPNLPQASAKIYQFSVRARTTAGGVREEIKPAGDLRSPRIAAVAAGSGWYHEAAIQESQQGRDR